MKCLNILYIMVDDFGYFDIYVFGGEINMLNFDVFVVLGCILLNYYMGIVCVIMCVMLVLGIDYYFVGEGMMGVLIDEWCGLFGYEGYLNDCVLLFV